MLEGLVYHGWSEGWVLRKEIEHNTTPERFALDLYARKGSLQKSDKRVG